jgi:20S proteasome alpha/beta subunit
MTLCIAAICQDRGKSRIVVATDWKASIVEASAENQDKLRWVSDNIPMLLAGTVSRAIELQATYKQFFASLGERTPPLMPDDKNIGDLVRKPVAIFKAKLTNEYVSLNLGLPYKDFRESVGKGEIPDSVATDTYAEIKNIDLGCSVILPFFLKNDAYIFRVGLNGGVEECDNFAAIGSGAPIAEGILFQREQEDNMTLGRTTYHLYEAMKLGSIASDVGQEHTLDVLYPPGEKGEEIVGERLTEKAERFLQRKFKRLGPKKFANMPLPPKFWRPDF